jgi:transcriptional antiterminator RfaH
LKGSENSLLHRGVWDVGAVGATASCDRRWYAVKTQPRKEALAQLHLQRQRFETFLPIISQMVRGPSGFVSRKSAFFPGYLFTLLDLGVDRWRSINSTAGVSRLVEFGGRPAAAPPGLIDCMRDLASEAGEVGVDNDIAVGSTVRVVGGPFDRLVGILQKSDANERVTVLIELMRRRVSVSVSRSSVVVAL